MKVDEVALTSFQGDRRIREGVIHDVTLLPVPLKTMFTTSTPLLYIRNATCGAEDTGGWSGGRGGGEGGVGEGAAFVIN